MIAVLGFGRIGNSDVLESFLPDSYVSSLLDPTEICCYMVTSPQLILFVYLLRADAAKKEKKINFHTSLSCSCNF